MENPKMEFAKGGMQNILVFDGKGIIQSHGGIEFKVDVCKKIRFEIEQWIEVISNPNIEPNRLKCFSEALANLRKENSSINENALLRTARMLRLLEVIIRIIFNGDNNNDIGEYINADLAEKIKKPSNILRLKKIISPLFEKNYHFTSRI